MNSLERTISDRSGAVLLLLVLCVAFAVRFKGVWFGYPLPVHPDEPILVDIALRMLLAGDLNPHYFNYPTLNIYIQALIFRLVQLVGYLFLDKSPAELPVIWYYLAGRTFNVLLSVLTIGVIYIIGKRLLCPLAGLLAATFLAFSFLHVANSFLLTVDVSVAFWASLVTLMATMILTEGKSRKYYILGGIFVGLAVSSKYTAFVSAAPLFVAHYVQSREKKDWIDGCIVTCVIAIPVVFLMTTPYSLLDFGNFLAALRIEAEHYSTGHPGAQSDTTTSYLLYATYLTFVGYGVVPMAFSALGLVMLIVKAPWKAFVIAAIPILLYIFVGRYKVFFPRNLVATIPFLALFSGIGVFFLYSLMAEKLSLHTKFGRVVAANVVLVAVLAASVWQQGALVVDHVRKITLPDTRWESLVWIKDNLPPGSRIGREHYTPPVEKYTKKFNAVYLGFFAVFRQQQALKKLDYMIVSSGDYERFLWRQDVYPDESRAYLEFFEKNKVNLVNEFSSDSGEFSGPRISIYRVRSR